MQSQLNRKLMIGLLIALLVIKFVLVPIFDWQQEKISQIEITEQRLIKTQKVIERLPLIEEAFEKLQQQTTKQQALLFKEPTLNNFKLKLQQNIESHFAEHALKVNNFSWVAELPEQISEARAEVSFDGQMKDFATLQLAIARLPQILNILQWQIRVDRMDDESLGKVNGKLLIAAYNINSGTEEQK